MKQFSKAGVKIFSYLEHGDGEVLLDTPIFVAETLNILSVT
jgi:hypothetical protein